MADVVNLEALAKGVAEGLGLVLRSLLGRDAQVHSKEVQTTGSENFLSGISGHWLVTILQGLGGFPGPALLLTGEKNSAIMADLLIGQDGTSAPDKVTELHLSAFGEVLQQLTEVLNKGIQQYAGPKAGYSIKSTESKEVGSMETLLTPLGSPLAIISFALDVPGLFTGEMWLCLPDLAAARLANPAGTPTVAQAPVEVSVQPSGVSMNTQMRAGGTSMQQFEQEFSGSTRPAGGNIGLLLDVPLKLTVELGRTTKLVKEILALAPGSVVELDKLAGEAVDILVNEKPIAKGEVVVIDENFGVRITEILNPEERLTAVQS
jgi:flagellar motor switch protein FliN/FliY